MLHARSRTGRGNKFKKKRKVDVIAENTTNNETTWRKCTAARGLVDVNN